MNGFVKLYGTVLDSSVWIGTPKHVKLAWITLLVMADSTGAVEASVPGLAKRAEITIAECEEALASFLAPDPYSKSKEHEGRRIEPIEGGWRVLNRSRYRDRRSRKQVYDAERMQALRGSQQDGKSTTSLQVDTTSLSNDKKSTTSRPETETETETEKVKGNSNNKIKSLAPDGAVVSQGHANGSHPPPGDPPALLPMPPRSKGRRKTSVPRDGVEDPLPETEGSWVSRFGDDYFDLTGSIPNHGKIGKLIAPVVQAKGVEEARKAWRAYCLSEKKQFGVAYFVEHCGEYAPRLMGIGGTLTPAEIAELSRD